MPTRAISWQRILLWLALVKVAYLGLLCGAGWSWSDFDAQRLQAIHGTWFDKADARWSAPGRAAFARHFSTWDAEHYLFLSEVGYARDVKSCAFYPLWPLVVRWGAFLTGGGHLLTGLVLANVCSLAGWLLFFQITAKRFGESTAVPALGLLILFPGSLFFQFIYTESLFFLLVMLLWRGLEENRYGQAWVAAFLLPLSRAVGVFTILPIAWYWLMRRRWNWLDRWRWLREERARATGPPGQLTPANAEYTEPPPFRVLRVFRGRCPETALVLAPLLGLAFYFLLMRFWTGNAFEGFQAQRHWGAHSISNLWNVPKFIVGYITPTVWHEFRGSVLDRCAFMLLLCALPMIWRLGKDLVVWTYVLGILPAMSGTFASYIRYESMVFPLFIAMAVFFSQLKAKWPIILFGGLSALLHGVLLWRFVNYRWAG